MPSLSSKKVIRIDDTFLILRARIDNENEVLNIIVYQPSCSSKHTIQLQLSEAAKLLHRDLLDEIHEEDLSTIASRLRNRLKRMLEGDSANITINDYENKSGEALPPIPSPVNEPSEVTIDIDIADSAFQEGRYNDAKSIYEVLIEQHPDNPSLYNGFTNTLLKLNEFERVISECKRLISLIRRQQFVDKKNIKSNNPGPSSKMSTYNSILSEAYFKMGLAFENLSRENRAVTAYVLAAKTSSDSTSAKEAIARVTGDRKSVSNEKLKNTMPDVEDLLEQHRLLDINETFGFSCTMCGECCRSADHILLSPWDMFRISRSPALALLGIKTTVQLLINPRFKKAFHFVLHKGLPVNNLRPVLESERGYCHFAYPLYTVAHEVDDDCSDVKGEDTDMDDYKDGNRSNVSIDAKCDDSIQEGQQGLSNRGHDFGTARRPLLEEGKYSSGKDSDGDGSVDDHIDIEDSSDQLPPPYADALDEKELEDEECSGGGGGGGGGWRRVLMSFGEVERAGLSCDGAEDVLRPLHPSEYNVTAEEEEDDEEEEEEVGQDAVTTTSGGSRKGVHKDGKRDDDNDDDDDDGNGGNIFGRGDEQEPPEAVYNGFGRHALGCMLGVAHMPAACASYPAAPELSQVDFWHVRTSFWEDDNSGKIRPPPAVPVAAESKSGGTMGVEGGSFDFELFDGHHIRPVSAWREEEKVVVLKTTGCEGFVCDGDTSCTPIRHGEYHEGVISVPADEDISVGRFLNAAGASMPMNTSHSPLSEECKGSEYKSNKKLHNRSLTSKLSGAIGGVDGYEELNWFLSLLQRVSSFINVEAITSSGLRSRLVKTLAKIWYNFDSLKSSRSRPIRSYARLKRDCEALTWVVVRETKRFLTRHHTSMKDSSDSEAIIDLYIALLERLNI